MQYIKSHIARACQQNRVEISAVNRGHHLMDGVSDFGICRSNTPQVDGFVIIRPAVRSLNTAFKQQIASPSDVTGISYRVSAHDCGSGG